MSKDYLAGLKRKIMARDMRRSTGKCLHYGTYFVPAVHPRSTRAERQEAHKARMENRRAWQRATGTGFFPVNRKGL